MKKTLLDVIFASEKRKNVILLLEDEPKEMEYLLKSLNTTRQALLPQIKMLEDHHLVYRHGDTYELTSIGKLMVDDMVPLQKTVEVFEENLKYWGSRKIGPIPPHLLKKIKLLGKCRVVNPSLVNIFTPPEEIYHVTRESYETVDMITGSSIRSKSYWGFTTFFYPNNETLISTILNNKVNMNFVIGKELYRQVKNGEYPYLKDFLKNDLFHFYVYPHDVGLLSLAFTGSYFLIRLLNKDGIYDHKYLLCSNPSAVEWAKELFDYYLKDSTPITEI